MYISWSDFSCIYMEKHVYCTLYCNKHLYIHTMYRFAYVYMYTLNLPVVIQEMAHLAKPHSCIWYRLLTRFVVLLNV